MRIGILVFIYTMHFAYLKVHTKFQNTGFNKGEKCATEKCIGEKK